MKDIFKNIIAILLHIWILPFMILIIIIAFVGSIPILLFKSEKFIYFKRNQKQWKITKALEKINDYLQDVIQF